jgi:CubicO group peptidase (beta-lactamase class C family)
MGFEKAKSVLRDAITQRELPSAVAVVGTATARELVLAEGVTRGGGQAVQRETLYDLASLTKVVATLPLALKLVSDKAFRLDDTVGKFFSNAGWNQTPSLADVRIRDLLTHTSGLPAWKPLFAWVSERATVIANVLQTPLEQPSKFVYSDLGFILLGAILECITEKREDVLAKELFAGLEMPRTFYRPVKFPELVEGNIAKGNTTKETIAATENCGWRGRLLVGEVHDENAFVMNGVAGHAGLFGTADDLATYAQAWLNLDNKLAGEAILHEATTLQLEQNGHRRGLGWLLKGENSFAGNHATLQGFGHTGFTGTSLWLEPKANWFAVLLTNRVHPTRQHGQNIHAIRQVFHTAVAEAFL